MALSIGINGTQDLGANLLASQHHKEHQLPAARGQHQEALKKDGGIGNVFWSRPESRLWTTMLLLGTCLLYCARVLMPICVVTMSSRFDWDKKQSGIVLSSFFWGYCLTQVVGGHLSDQYGQYYIKSGVSNSVSLRAASRLGLTSEGTGDMARGHGHLDVTRVSGACDGLSALSVKMGS